MDVTSSTIRNLENGVLKRCGHMEKMKITETCVALVTAKKRERRCESYMQVESTWYFLRPSWQTDVWKMEPGRTDYCGKSRRQIH
jgi:hypothetical protein